MPDESGKTSTPAVLQPRGTDHDWKRKIDIARAVGEQKRIVRVGKPVSFRSAIGRNS